MRELRNRPIAVKRGRTQACKRKEKADLQRPNNVSESFSKKSRSHNCISGLRFPKKGQVNPKVCWSLLLLILAFPEQRLGNFSRNSPGTAAQEKGSSLSAISTNLRALRSPDRRISFRSVQAGTVSEQLVHFCEGIQSQV
jgi:hypothetical protein